MCKLTKIYIIIIELLMNAIITKQYHVGDTVDISIKNNQISDIFNGYDGSKFIETEYFDNKNSYQMTPESCLLFESLEKYFYPKVYVDGKSSTTKVSKSFHYTYFSRDPNFGINPNYVNNNHFRYGIVKLCKIIQTQYINSTWMQFPNINSNVGYKILLNTTAIIRFKRDNETHYISSMSTAKCLVQIYIKDEIFCRNHNNTSQSLSAEIEFFKNSIYKSHIMTVSDDANIEHQIDEYFYLNDINYSLYTFFDLNRKHQKNIFNKIGYSSAVNLALKSLPEFFIPKTKIVQMKSKINPEDIIPGDAINIEELLDSNQKKISVRNAIVIDKDNETTTPIIFSKCDSCFKRNKSQISGEFNFFYEQMMRRNNGVDRSYIAEYVYCCKIIICAALKKLILDFPSLKVIKLNEKSKDDTKKNIFENENIMLLYSNQDETHYVKETDRGNCLLQVFIYPEEIFSFTKKSEPEINDPIHKGKILSATNNQTLEKWAEMISNSDLRNIIGDKNNISMGVEIFNQLSLNDPLNSALISLYLDEFY